MLYSTRSEYAILALTYLAQRPPGAFAMVPEIADSEDVPRPYLAKILQELARAGLLRSARGPTGGYALARPASEISLADVRGVLEGLADLERCAVGLEPCSDTTPCPLHDRFKPLRHAIRSYLEQTTIDDLERGLWEKRTVVAQIRLSATATSPRRS